MPALTPSSDLAVLHSLSDKNLKGILALLDQTNPRESTIRSRVPDEFLRLLYIYSDVVGASATPAHMTQGLDSVREWFDVFCPNLQERPGFPKLLETARNHMESYALVQEAEQPADRRLKAMVESIGNITAFSSQPALTGPDYIPTIRVFLFSDDHLLLDSTGDWSDWLYLADNLLSAIDEQSSGIPAQIEIGESVVAKLTARLDMIEERVSSIRQFLNEHAAGDT